MKDLSRRKKVLLCSLLLNVLAQMQVQLVIIADLTKMRQHSSVMSDNAKYDRRNPDARISFSDLVNRTHKRAFRSMFRIDNKCCNKISSRIETNVGRDVFKSEAYLDSLSEKTTADKKIQYVYRKPGYYWWLYFWGDTCWYRPASSCCWLEI